MYTRNEKIIPIHIEQEMKDSYINYAMSVIVGRALPDVRDGLKPVHRRILYAMRDLHLDHSKPYKKSARIVGECFVRGTNILTQKGLVPIQDIKRNDLVYTQKSMRRVTELYEMPPKELLRIELRNGTYNTVTPAQKIKVLNKDFKFQWKKANEIKKGDHVVLKAHYPEVQEKVKLLKTSASTPSFLNEDIAYLLGIFMSEGYITKNENRNNTYRIGISCNSREIMEKVADVLMKEFDYVPTVSEKSYVFQNSKNEKIRKIQYTIRISKNYICDFLVQNFKITGVKAPGKNIPQQIFTSPKTVIYAFISGLIDGDGSVHKNRAIVHYGSVSEKLIDQLQILLQHLDVFSTKYTTDKRGEKNLIGLRAIRNTLVFHSLEAVGINAKTLCSKINLYDCVKNKRAADLLEKKLKKSTHEIVPFAGKNIFGELSQKHIGGGWYKPESGEKFRLGVKYNTGCKIRYPKNLANKPLRKSQIVEWGIREKLERIESPLCELIEHMIENDVYFMEVSAITKAPAQSTYDIQVEGEHEFVANGMVSHNCLGKYHPHGDTAVYDALVRMAQDFSLRYPLVDGQGNFGCFTKDTKVKLTDNRALSFGELIKEDKEGKKNYTYTYNVGKGQIEIAQIEQPRLTRREAELVEVKLDNDETIKCTPNHRFMLKNGTYKEAKNLKPGESLMPLYARLSTPEDDPNMADYEMIYQPSNNKWEYAHRLADEWNLKYEIYPRSAGKVRHHIDFNKLNNNPDNIRRSSWGEHWQVHYEQTAARHKNNPEYVRKLAKGRNGYWNTKGTKEKYSKLFKKLNKKNWEDPKYREKMIKAVKEKWKDPEYKKHMATLSSERLKTLWRKPGFGQWRGKLKSEELKKKWKDESYRTYMAEIMRERSYKMWENPVHRRRISESSRKNWLNPEYKRRMSKKSEKQWQDPDYKKHMVTCYRRKWRDDPDFREKFIAIFSENGKKAHSCRFLKVCKKAISKHRILDEKSYEKERINYNGRRGEGIVKYKKGLTKYFDTDISKVYKRLELNHKVINVKKLKKKEDVYDLTIENTHNFALASGIFVHNSVDGDTAAAMRYTEARLETITDFLLQDLEKNTVRFVPNFDNSLQEPSTLPAIIPNLLINGSSGIAVGMATNIPPHNLNEVADGIIHLIDNPECTIKDLMKKIKGPDFPTGGIIRGKQGIQSAYETGRGKVLINAKAAVEELKGGRESIVITEIPYQVNKSNLITSIAALVQDKKIEGISDLRDESDKDGMRIVVELKRNQNTQIILNQLYKHTQMKTTYGIIMLALVNNRPEILNLKRILSLYVDHRKDVITKRTIFDKEKAEARAHILEGLKIALKNLDRVIKIIKQSSTPEMAKKELMKKLDLSDKQAQAILEMQLQRLTNLEREKIDNEYKELLKKIEYLNSILASEKKVLGLIKEDLGVVVKKFGDERRTELLGESEDLEMEDLIQEEDVVITISHSGYIKRLPIGAYRQQKRGGKGVSGAGMSDEDFIEDLFIASTHDNLLFFTDKGKAFVLKVYDIPQAARTSKGKAIINMLSLSAEEKITSSIPVKEFAENTFLMMITSEGKIKKTKLSAFANIRKSGIISVSLSGKDSLIGAKLTSGSNEVFIATKDGKAIRFSEKAIRDMGRGASGVRGIKLGKKDEVVGMEIITDKKATLLTVAENGYSKRTEAQEYRIQSRGGKGIINLKVTEKNGSVVGIKLVSDNDEMMIITIKGMVVRCAVKDIRATGRSAQGVRIIKLDKGDTVTSVAKLVKEE